ncbi:MAG: RsmF rRNA methyltransferase first C-terminal domain-containing protein [Lachnospiraceae bacterium]|nr:RsmF rRNA methyltransferase first C-terminal domain-containing protein [Lachnospiraceae bacterium]
MSDFLPIDFENRMRALLGDEYEAFESALSGERYRGLRINPLKKKDAIPFGLTEKVPWAECGYYYGEDITPGKHPYHEAGAYYIQEPSAMLPATLLEAKPGEKILDLCAAPGGKSTQIAAAMNGKGLLVSNEINSKRAAILSENIERMGIKNAVVTNESPAMLVPRFEGFFDRIMVDAPCSGEGMFRKNEEAVSEWSAENVKLCAERQSEILDCAAKMLRRGGRIVYSTCTFAKEEDELSIENFLKRNPDFTCEKMERLWPHKVRGEGHFAAVLTKEGDSERAIIESAVSSADLKKLREYFKDILKDECFEEGGFFSSGRLESFGDNIYLVPSLMPNLKGIKVLRAGLALGVVKKDRFEPAHSLALALTPDMVLRSINLDINDSKDYIKGLTKNVGDEKGWTLVLTDGYSLGWGKAAGGVLKNHYPKGLRKDL